MVISILQMEIEAQWVVLDSSPGPLFPYPVLLCTLLSTPRGETGTRGGDRQTRLLLVLELLPLRSLILTRAPEGKQLLIDVKCALLPFNPLKIIQRRSRASRNAAPERLSRVGTGLPGSNPRLDPGPSPPGLRVLVTQAQAASRGSFLKS